MKNTDIDALIKEIVAGKSVSECADIARRASNKLVELIQFMIVSGKDDIDNLETFLEEVKGSLDPLIKGNPVGVIESLLTQMYVREMVIKAESEGAPSRVESDKPKPNADFRSAARKAIAALQNIPEAGSKVSVAQEDEHMDALLGLTATLKHYDAEQA